MMDKKDKNIRELFDSYADTLESRPELANKAREKMHSRTDNAAHKKRVVFISLASVASAAASIAIGVFAIGAFLRVTDRNYGSGEAPSMPDTSTRLPAEYDKKDVRAVKISREDTSQYFDVSVMEKHFNYDVYDENYYACYLKDSDTLVYIRASFAMSSEYGPTRVGVVVENSDYRRTDLNQSYSELISISGKRNIAKDYIDGEYVSQIYFANDEMHYYVSTMGTYEYAYYEVMNIFDY